MERILHELIHPDQCVSSRAEYQLVTAFEWEERNVTVSEIKQEGGNKAQAGEWRG